MIQINDHRRRVADIDAEIERVEARRQALGDERQHLLAECHAVGAVRGTAGFRLAEIDAELQRLERRAEQLRDDRGACEFRLKEAERRRVEARRILHELPTSARSREEVEVIEELRRVAQKIIKETTEG